MLSKNTTRLFGLSILNTTMKEAIGALLPSDQSRITAAFVNAHCINMAKKHEDYQWALSRADVVLPDGSGMQVAAKLNGTRFTENLNGTDLFLPLCKEAAAQGRSIFFLGSQEGVAERAAQSAVREVPDLKVAGTHHGYFSESEEDSIIRQINQSGAHILLVALGVPRQEVWISRNRHRLKPALVLGVGAQFDFWSGRVPRAPKLLRQLGLEWIFRLAVEPKRMARRYLIGNFQFVGHAIADALTKKSEGKRDSRLNRAFDFFASGAALIALAPLLLLIAAAIKLESRGPVFFKQTRVGKNGEPFELIKFRSMYKDAERRRQSLLVASDRRGVCFKSKKDPRITKVGKLLRRTSLDELPQLINVLTGTMSLVGPRPALPQEVAAYPEKALGRLAARPGITGVWQISGRAEISFEKMIAMDLAYVRSRCLVLNIAILLLTVRAVISGRGAY